MNTGMDTGHRIASQADHLDKFISVEILADRALRQVSLRLHETCGWASKLGRNSHDRVCIAARAVGGIGRDRDRANKYEGGEHCREVRSSEAIGVECYLGVFPFRLRPEDSTSRRIASDKARSVRLLFGPPNFRSAQYLRSAKSARGLSRGRGTRTTACLPRTAA
jgi:hypothetical protein